MMSFEKITRIPSPERRDDGGEIIVYSFPDYNVYSGQGEISLCPDYRWPQHWHDDIELSFLLKGDMQYDINGEIITVHEGEGIFINSKADPFQFLRRKEALQVYLYADQPGSTLYESGVPYKICPSGD